MSCHQVVRNLLTARGLLRATGKPLYTYRVTGEELEALANSLRNEFTVASWGGRDVGKCAAFCLYTAEWWRRVYESGAWAWGPVFSSIGKDPDLPIQLIYPTVELGLKYWQVPLLRFGEGTGSARHGWLVSLACQGGLPLRVLHKEGDRTREFLRRLLLDRQRFPADQITTRQLAVDHEDALPVRLRNEVFLELGANVVDGIARLLELRPDARDPVGDLDRRLGEWRKELPLDVDDSAARDLLTLLVREAVEARAGRRGGLSVATAIKRAPNGWSLERKLHVPPTTAAASFSVFTGQAGRDLPQRFEVYRVLPDGGKDRLVVATRFGGTTEDPLVTLETGGAQPPLIRGRAAAATLTIELTSSRQRIGSGPAPGGAALSDLPWIFVERESAGELRLLAQGSTRTRDSVVYIALPDGSTLECSEGASSEATGSLEELDRQVVRFSGQAWIRTIAGALTVVRTGSDADDLLEYFPSRPDGHDAAGQPLYRSVPRLLRFQPDGVKKDEVALAELEWRPKGGLRPWRNDAKNALGLCDIRHAPGGEVRYQSHFAIVPAPFAQNVTPGPDGRSGTVFLTGLQENAVVTCEAPSSVTAVVARTEDGWRVDVAAGGEPPTTLGIGLEFRDSRHLEMTVPFPVRAARFIGRDGRVLADRQMVCLEQIGGVKAQVLAPGQRGDYVVDVALRCDAADYLLAGNLEIDERLHESFPGCHEIDLAHLRESLELMLTATTALDAYFDVRIRAVRGPSVPLRRIRITRYELDFNLIRGEGRIRLREQPGGGAATTSSGIRVRAVPLLNPAAKEELEVDDGGGWSFLPASRAPGPWVLAGFEGEYCRVRPTRWFVPEPGGAVTVPAAKELTVLSRTAMLSDPQSRRARFAEEIQRLSEAPDDEQWTYVQETIEAFWSMPPMSHDLFVGLSRVPAALPSVLLALSHEKLRRGWDYLERLPIFWHAVPVAAWRRAVWSRAEALSQALTCVTGFGEEKIAEAAKDYVDGALAPLRNRYPAIEILEHLVRLPLGTNLRRTSAIQYPPVVLKHAAAGWSQTVLRAIEHERLPEWQGLNDLKTMIEKTLRPPSDTWVEHGVPTYSLCLLNAPVCAAWVCAGKLDLGAEEVFHLRRLRAFDPQGFDAAYAARLGLAVLHMEKANPEVLA